MNTKLSTNPEKTVSPEALARLRQPFYIGTNKLRQVKLDSRVMLAPMAGVTDVVFRSLVRQWAPQSLICTEMISSNGLVYSKRWDVQILDKQATDSPIAYQLAAHRVEVLVEAAENIIKLKNPETIDLNMGCPVKKITGNFEGCSLMKNPDLAHTLISTLVKAVDRPVTVKFRLGWDHSSINFKAFGQMCEDAGASMVTLHARTRSDGYKPGCKWEAFGELKQAVNIPVIANGDINTLEDALTVMDTYGVDGVMIGRGALGQPWVIGHIDQAIRTGALPTPLTLEERLEVAYEHAKRLATYKSEPVGVREMRRHLTDYVNGFHGASRFRSQLTAVNTLEDIRLIIDEILEAQMAIAV